jgi:hypothetical protein
VRHTKRCTNAADKHSDKLDAADKDFVRNIRPQQETQSAFHPHIQRNADRRCDVCLQPRSLALSTQSDAAQSRLAFGARFYCDRSVPAGDKVTSLSAIGGNAHQGAAAFTTTHWTVVLEAQGESPVAQAALESLCRTYWRPIYREQNPRVKVEARTLRRSLQRLGLITGPARRGRPSGK